MNGILALGITGAPVVDEQGQAVGMVSLRDLVSRRATRVTEYMTRPAETIGEDALVAEAGHRLAASGRHRLYTRLTDMLAEPQTDRPILAWWLAQRPLRYRAAAAPAPDARGRALEVLRSRAPVMAGR